MNVCKKVLAVIAVAVAMAACNNSGADAAASPTASADSATKTASDSVKVSSDSSAMKKDSAATDTTKKM